ADSIGCSQWLSTVRFQIMDVSVPAMRSLRTSFAFQSTQVSSFCPSHLPPFAILRIAAET
ncbi:MAG TPA: hypothetical protein VIS72_17550, partial [Anaerolineales bacterium]